MRATEGEWIQPKIYLRKGYLDRYPTGKRTERDWLYLALATAIYSVPKNVIVLCTMEEEDIIDALSHELAHWAHLKEIPPYKALKAINFHAEMLDELADWRTGNG